MKFDKEETYQQRVDKSLIKAIFQQDQPFLKKLKKFEKNPVYLTPFVN